MENCEPIMDIYSFMISLMILIWILLFINIQYFKNELKIEKQKTEFYRKKFEILQIALSERVAVCDCDI